MSLHPYPTPYCLATPRHWHHPEPHTHCLVYPSPQLTWGKSKGGQVSIWGRYKTQGTEEAKEHTLESQDSLS